MSDGESAKDLGAGYAGHRPSPPVSLDAVLDSITEGFYTIDESGACTFINRVGAELLGYEPSELLGREMHAVMHHTRADGSPYAREDCPIQHTVTSGVATRLDDEVLWRRDGSSLPAAYTASPLVEGGRVRGAVVTFQDITRRRNAERALAAERARLRNVFVNAPAAIALYTGPDHVISMANPTWEMVSGRTDVVGKRLRDAFPELVGTGLLDLLDEVYRSGKPYVGAETPVRLNRNGRTEDTYWNFVWEPLPDPEGRSHEIFLHAVEVTDQVRARKAVEQQADELRKLTAALEASNRELDQFAYIASHDLKAPLRGLANLATWIEEDLAGIATPGVRAHLALLHGRVQRMEALINGILEYSRAGRDRSQPERIATERFLRELIELLAPPANARIDLPRDPPPLIVERVPFQQVVMNLVGNALKHARRADPHVELSIRDDGHAWEIAVRDNGPGIAPEYHARIWEIFQTLETRDKVEGTGIGLSVVKKIVETRGGRVWVESSPGAGATFRVVWPKP